MPKDLSPAALTLQSLHHPTEDPGPSSVQRLQPTITAPPTPFDTIRALSDAPFMKTYITDPTFLLSGEEFFEDNPLMAASIKPATQQKYALALENFRDSPAASENVEMSIDQRLAIYVQERFLQDPRAGQRQEMANLVCMFLLMYPSLRDDLGLARRCLSGWKILKPARSAAPFTRELVFAFAWHLHLVEKTESATILLLSFAGCLRVSEALKLQWQHVALPGDLRLAAYGPDVAGFNIHDAKTSRYTGKLQFVKVSDTQVVKYLIAKRRYVTDDTTRVGKVTYQQYCSDLSQAALQFKLQDQPFTTHSARIGQATEEYIKGKPVDQIAIHGRWKSLNSLRYYLNNGRAWILNTKMSKEVQKSVQRAARHLQDLIGPAEQTQPALSESGMFKNR